MRENLFGARPQSTGNLAKGNETEREERGKGNRRNAQSASQVEGRGAEFVGRRGQFAIRREAQSYERNVRRIPGQLI